MVGRGLSAKKKGRPAVVTPKGSAGERLQQRGEAVSY